MLNDYLLPNGSTLNELPAAPEGLPPAEEDEMTTQLFPANDRFATKINWLNSKHSFSFGHHYDPNRMGFRNLRVINDDIVAPASGFPMHGHADMEIVTYILDGSLEHKDSIGTGSVIRPGDAQRMSAGTGIRHSEFNPSRDEGVHLLQIWIEPAKDGIAPSYEQKALKPADGKLVPVATPDGRDGSVTIHANAAIHAAKLKAGETVTHKLATGNGWIHVARGGKITVNGQTLVAGDGLALEGVPEVTLTGAEDAQSEVLVFDLD
jgi:redox-sensitive bicupin YhaK (pirin superfamily)